MASVPLQRDMMWQLSGEEAGRLDESHQWPENGWRFCQECEINTSLHWALCHNDWLGEKKFGVNITQISRGLLPLMDSEGRGAYRLKANTDSSTLCRFACIKFLWAIWPYIIHLFSTVIDNIHNSCLIHRIKHQSWILFALWIILHWISSSYEINFKES